MTAPWHQPNTVGDVDAAIVLAKQKLARYSYGKPANDGTPIYTVAFGTALAEYQRRRNIEIDQGKYPGPKMTKPGELDYATKIQLEIVPRAGGGANPPAVTRLGDVHYLGAPGSGAGWWIGPSFDVGEWLKENLGVHHWPLGFPIGGYLGLMGGDSAQSYIDTVALCGAELERRIREDVLPLYGVQLAPGETISMEDTDALPAGFKLLVSGYSQSAEAVVRACERLFGDGGIYAALRSYLTGVLVFGSPVRQGGPTRYGRSPRGKGISGYVAPAWLAALLIDVVTETPTAPDFYACNVSPIATAVYDVVIHAETELPFVVYLAKLAIPAILGLVSGGIFGPGGVGGVLTSAATVPILAGLTGMTGGQLLPFVNMAQGADDDVLAPLRAALTPTGLLTSLPELIGLLLALPGIQTHGEYHLPKSEFGGRTGVQVGIDQLRALL
ncbi:lysin B [Mycobacterium phage Vincenzo]|uniref:Lysin B n=2 Tax=Coopervirus vincenzo TaxID=1983110 RepID=A0A0F6SJJ1_9CAUD|nr:lysin B [Mycobacterium phage Vincenzo]AKF14307.1 lysin B [Mycobacterium phage Vincenzo]AKF14711.1 lysin B [Mycobacterium phage AlanGrant]